MLNFELINFEHNRLQSESTLNYDQKNLIPCEDTFLLKAQRKST
jgi:hypothetical protein